MAMAMLFFIRELKSISLSVAQWHQQTKEHQFCNGDQSDYFPNL